MTDEEEQAYEEGHRSAWRHLFTEATRHLGYANVPVAVLATEREAAIATLRSACREFGDNDWPDNLHLSDIIEKHLLRYIEVEE